MIEVINDLKKGDYITQAFCEKLFEVRFNEEPIKYRAELMALVSEICRFRKDLYPCTEQNGIKIMTDREAETYNINSAEKRITGLRSDVRKRGRIDTVEFNDHEKRVSGLRDMNLGMIAVNASKEFRKMERDSSKI